jgi:hypothetical protein
LYANDANTCIADNITCANDDTVCAGNISDTRKCYIDTGAN